MKRLHLNDNIYHQLFWVKKYNESLDHWRVTVVDVINQLHIIERISAGSRLGEIYNTL